MPLTDRFVLAGIGGALLLAGAAGWMLLTPGGSGSGPSPEPVAVLGSDQPIGSEGASPSPDPELVIDVEGAVAEPGIQRLPGGSRIAAARQEKPFQTLDELVERKVLTSAQLTKIRDLVTV